MHLFFFLGLRGLALAVCLALFIILQVPATASKTIEEFFPWATN